MRINFIARAILTVFIVSISAVSVFAVDASTGVSQSEKTQIEKCFGKLPLYFIKNQGQLHEDVAYYVKGSDKTLYFTSEGITFALTGKEGDGIKRWSVKLEFMGANENLKSRGNDKQKAVFSVGLRQLWDTGN